jgi:threonine dehydrogenase-like Zn-dependent dehydrogenase
MEEMMGEVRSLGFAAPGRAAIFAVDEPELGPGRFAVETLFSGFSAGTELTLFRGTNPHLRRAWDGSRGAFLDGPPSLGYPIPTFGYMEVARVSASDFAPLAPGDLLAMRYGHRTGHVADGAQDFWVRLPAGLDPVLGTFVGQLGPVCGNALLHAAHDLHGPGARGLGDGVAGRDVLVVGAGPVGLLTGLFAGHHGARAVAVADDRPAHLAAVRALGLTPVDTAGVEAWRYCKEEWGHQRSDRGADVAFQCRADAGALAGALRALRPQGVVVDLAFYHGPVNRLPLGEEFHHNGLAIRSAHVSRVPRGMGARWDRTRLAHETIDLLLAHGGAVRQAVVSDVVAFESGPAAIARLAADPSRVVQLVLSFP